VAFPERTPLRFLLLVLALSVPFAVLGFLTGRPHDEKPLAVLVVICGGDNCIPET
jgi:hypothetical protein